jgi:hypothetical protein
MHLEDPNMRCFPVGLPWLARKMPLASWTAIKKQPVIIDLDFARMVSSPGMGSELEIYHVPVPRRVLLIRPPLITAA